VLDIIISVQPKEAGIIGAESREVVVARQAKEMLEKVPGLYDMFEVKERSINYLLPLNNYILIILNINYFINKKSNNR